MITSDGRARVRRAVAPMHGEPRVSAPQTSQVVAGHVVHVLEQRGDWCRVRSADDYTGWMHSGYLELPSGSETGWRLSIGVTVAAQNGTLHALPVNARIDDAVTIVRGTAVPAAELAERFPRSAAAITRSATQLFAGASYQWGGVTEWGCDCSGLVQSAFALHGCVLPRDAYQQAACGDLVSVADLREPARFALLTEGDLVFFSDRDDRRITHVGIVLPDARMVHSALGRGGVCVEDLQGADEYVQRLRANFVMARRVVR